MKRMWIVVMLMIVLATPGLPAVAQSARTFQLDFREAPLAAVLQTLARAAGANLIVEGELAGRVTLHLNRLTFEQTLRLLAAAYRLTWTVTGGVYVVRQLPPASGGLILPEGAQPLPVDLRAYPLRYARAEDVADALSKAVAALSGSAAPAPPAAPSPQLGAQPSPGPTPPTPGGGQTPAPPTLPAPAPAPPASGGGQTGGQGGNPIAVVADPASNSLLVAAPVLVHLQVQAVLRALDVPAARLPLWQPAPGGAGQGEQVGPNTVAYTVQFADPDALAKILTAEVRGITVTTDARTRRLLVSGPARRQEDVVRLVALLDRPIPQVMMSTQVVELNENASRKLGIQWTWNPTIRIEQTPGGIQISGDPLFNMIGRLTASVEQGEGRVLANPTVATQDGKKATINVGQTLYVPITTTQGGKETTTMQTVNAGIKLEVTPRIIPTSEGGPQRLNAELNIEVNSLGGYGPQGYPIINSRAVTTQLEVLDGAPIVIGGLISDTTTELLRKIPLLGDIPLLGGFFLYRERTRAYSNIVIVIIPRVLLPAR